MKIEFAVLWDDHTWSTTVEEVPFKEDDQLEDIQVWANVALMGQTRFRKAAMCCIYNDNPEEDS